VLNYEAAKSHSVTVRTTDAGGLTFDETFTINVSNVNEIVGFDVQRGASQRSYIRYVDLVFESSEGLAQLVAGGRLSLTRYSLAGTGGGAVSLANRATVIGNRIQLDFGANGIGGSRNSATGDGYYRLRADTDGDGTLEATRHFYRLLGDTNGDRTVNNTDVNRIIAERGRVGTNLNTDINGDGIVNNTDRDLARRQLGRSVSSTLPLND
jgi:hypothetical protein